MQIRETHRLTIRSREEYGQGYKQSWIRKILQLLDSQVCTQKVYRSAHSVLDLVEALSDLCTAQTDHCSRRRIASHYARTAPEKEIRVIANILKSELLELACEGFEFAL